MFQQLSSSGTTLQYTTLFLSIGMLITSLEYLVNYKLFSSEGILDWRIMSTHWKNGVLKNALNFIMRRNLLNPLIAFRVLFLFLLLSVPVFSTSFWICAIIILFTYSITSLVSFYGSDGSDQMSILILITICLCFAPFASNKLLYIGFLFIAAQSCLSYFVAGFSKLLSSSWRNGDAVQGIFRTRSYGSEKIYHYIKNKRGVNLFLCWSVIVAELLFPMVLFLPIEWGVGFLIWGMLFHLLNSLIMGLNTFFWAFLASYPSIIFIRLHSSI